MREGVKDSFTVKRHEGILNAEKKNGRIIGNAASITTIADIKKFETGSEISETEDLNTSESPVSHQVHQWENINSGKKDGKDNADTANSLCDIFIKETEPEDSVWTEPTIADCQKEEHAAEIFESSIQVDQAKDNLNKQSQTTEKPENQTAIQNSNSLTGQTKSSQSPKSRIDIMYGFVKEQILAEKMKREESQLVTESVSAMTVEKDLMSQPKSLSTDLVTNANIGEERETEIATWKVKERLVKTTIEKKSNS